MSAIRNTPLFSRKRFINVSTFSRSNYQARDHAGNADQSLSRVQYATGIRLIEDLQCLDDLLGFHNYEFRLLGEEESQVRGNKILNIGDGEMEMAIGSYEAFEDCDWEILRRCENVLSDIASQPDTAIILPSAMKGHIDHFIVREAGLKVMREHKTKAVFYFAEDKPYAGLLNEDEMECHRKFLAEYHLQPHCFEFDKDYLIHLAFEHYPSQVDEVYRTGINERVKQWQQEYQTDKHLDCIYKVQK